MLSLYLARFCGGLEVAAAAVHRVLDQCLWTCRWNREGRLESRLVRAWKQCLKSRFGKSSPTSSQKWLLLTSTSLWFRGDRTGYRLEFPCWPWKAWWCRRWGNLFEKYPQMLRVTAQQTSSWRSLPLSRCCSALCQRLHSLRQHLTLCQARRDSRRSKNVLCTLYSHLSVERRVCCKCRPSHYRQSIRSFQRASRRRNRCSTSFYSESMVLRWWCRWMTSRTPVG